MTFTIKLLTIILVALPELRLDWHSQDNNSNFKAELQGYSQELQTCAASGLAIRLRYEFQLCKDRKIWFDDCSPVKTAVNSFEYDPISETYLITKDFWGDVELPVSMRVDKLSKAILKVSEIETVPMEWISNHKDRNYNPENLGLRGKVIVECRGNYSESVKRLSSFLSLGLIKTSEFDSGWVKFSK